MLVVGLIEIEHMHSVIKVVVVVVVVVFSLSSSSSMIATILVIWKPSACLQQLSEGVSHNIEEKSLSSLSELVDTYTRT